MTTSLDAHLAVLISFNSPVFCGFRLLVYLEKILDIGFADRPQLLLDPLELLRNKIFLLPGEIGDAILYFRPPL